MRYSSAFLSLAALSLFVGACGGNDNNADGDSNNSPAVIVLVPDCTSHAECADSSDGPICELSSNTCVPGCLSDAGCEGSADGPICNTSTNTCEAECTKNSECSVAAPICDAGLCVPGCLGDGDCAGGADPVCDMDSNQCVPGCTMDTHCEGSADGPICNTDTKQCEPSTEGGLIGLGDGSSSSVTFTKIYSPSTPTETPDLGFNAIRDELWILNRRKEVLGTCSSTNTGSPRCRAMGTLTTIITSPGGLDQSVKTLEDQNSWHFMRRAPAIATSTETDFFATCGEAATGNFEDEPAMFIGPTLWSSAPEIYAQPSGGNGSHMDMLHATPWCMGIAFDTANVYWAFNGHVGSIDRYDFKEDHGPGNADHADGEIYRYAEGELERVPNVPSHMMIDQEEKFLYIADTGNARIARLSTKGGIPGRSFSPVYEPLAASGYMSGVNIQEVVSGGVLKQPSGLAVHEGIIYVSDHETSMFHAFDRDGNLVRSLQTDLPAKSLAGIEVGPDGKLWFVDMQKGDVYRID